jgi:hypothetical protein
MLGRGSGCAATRGLARCWPAGRVALLAEAHLLGSLLNLRFLDYTVLTVLVRPGPSGVVRACVLSVVLACAPAGDGGHGAWRAMCVCSRACYMKKLA